MDIIMQLIARFIVYRVTLAVYSTVANTMARAVWLCGNTVRADNKKCKA